MSARTPPILIAGAGIGGLALALGLLRRGVPVRLLEQRRELSEAGAGIQLGPNAMQVLNRLGLSKQLAPYCGSPLEIEIADGATGRRIGGLPLGAAMAQRYGAPYHVCHRADLQDVMAAAVSAAGIPLVYGFEVERWAENETGVHVHAVDGRNEAGAVLIGADGIWSQVRRGLFPGLSHTYSGKMAARALAPAALAPDRFARPVTGVWLGHSAHVVHYPVRAGREVAIVVIADEATSREGWGGPIESAAVTAKLAGFSSDLIDFLFLGTGWRMWSLYDPPPLPAWSRGRVGLIGDAAHPVLPFLAQGGAMALEDAETLAQLLSEDVLAPGLALQKFEVLRRGRVLQVQDASRANGRIFHMRGLPAITRNLALSVVPGALLMRRYDWLYRWNGDAI